MAKILSLTAQKDPKCSFNGPIIKPFAVKAFGLDRKGRREAASISYPPTPPQTAATALRLSSITLNVLENPDSQLTVPRKRGNVRTLGVSNSNHSGFL